jgi:plasmid stabilization system protein ParE
MTPYTVEWTSTAEDQLADIWLLASDPQAVTTATAAIDSLLAKQPSGTWFRSAGRAPKDPHPAAHRFL